MTEHHGLWRMAAVEHNATQQLARLGIGHVKPAVGIKMQPEQLQIVIAFDKDEIRIDEMPQQISPIIEVRGDGRRDIPILDNKAIRREKWMVRHLKRLESQIAHPERFVAERPELERAESISIEMPGLQLRQTALVNPDWNPFALKNSQWVIADMVAVHVRNNEGIDIMQTA